MRRMIIVWILYVSLLLTVFFCTSCSHTVVNGVRVKERKHTPPNKKEVFYMTVSFWLSYGIFFHFFNPKK